MRKKWLGQEASTQNSSIISHTELFLMIEFSVFSDNFCHAVGYVLRHIFAIPMQGPFSVRTADLRCLWTIHTQKACFCALGTPIVIPQGYLQHSVELWH